MPLKSALALFLLTFYIGGLYHVVVGHFLHSIKIIGLSF
jgi:type III secretory pathway component EscT